MEFYRPPTHQGLTDALGSIYRALRAWEFYPKGHPTRRSTLHKSHTALLQQLDGNDLLLNCGRTGFSFPDGDTLRDTSGQARSLAYELFVRRAQKITFQHDLRQEDLLDFVRMLTLSPEVVKKMGGLDVIMADHGIRSIWVNEFDLVTIRQKRLDIETRGITPQDIEEAEAGADMNAAVSLQYEAELPPDMQLQALLERLESAFDEDTYLILIRQALNCADSLIANLQIETTFPLAELLATHSVDLFRNQNLREKTQFALEQLAGKDVFLHAVLERIEMGGGLSKKALPIVLAAGGTLAVVLTVELMGSTSNLALRKTISNLLVEIGESTVPVLLDLVADERWYIVRNICTIFGLIGSKEAIPGLLRCLHHTDLRVCKESIRSLAMIGGGESETAIIEILRGNDSDLYPQTLTSLGGMKSRKALPELMRILFAKDMFLKSLPLKTDVLTALALIGDHQVTPYLLKLLKERHLLAAGRWKLLKVAIVQCLAKLGDTRAVTTLKDLSNVSGELGKACTEALKAIEKAGGTADGIA
ncbi:MAG TPA: HEAT repeat domain-containing protein [Desulfuromonadales bacterium]|nr:HEAT repeat domain-containing protein [Desulfuromonadales bacterium]